MNKKDSLKNKSSFGSASFEGVDRNSLNSRQKVTVNALEAAFGSMGINVVFFQSPTDAEGRHIGENGSYNKKTNTIRLDISAGIKGQDAILFTAAHELTHFIKEWSGDKFKVFSDFLVDNYAKRGVSIDVLVNQKIEHSKNSSTYEKPLTYPEAFEEVVCDSCETFLRDSKLMDKLVDLAKQDLSLFEKCKEYIDGLLESLRKSYAGLTPDSREANEVLKMTDAIEELHRLWEEAALSARENYLSGGKQKNTTDEGDVKNSLREMVGIEEFDKQTLNNIKMRKGIVVNTMGELKQHIEKALERTEQKNLYFGIISNKTKDKITNDVGGKIFKDKPYSFVVSYDDIIHISDHFGEDADVIANEIVRLYDIIQNYDTVELKIENNVKKLVFDKSYSDYDYRTVEIASNSKSTLDLVTLFVTKNNIKRRGQSSSPATNNSGSQRGSTSSNNKIPQLAKNVNKNPAKNSDRINQSMTMEQAKTMIQKSFVSAGIKDFYDDQYKNGDEWLKGEGIDEVAMYIENEYTLQEKYLNKIQAYLDGDIVLEEILQAYLDGTLVGQEKPKASRLDVSVNYRINDARFYSPKRVENVKELFEIAGQKLTAKNRADVSNARAKILLFAHNDGASELLGLTKAELNKKLRSWSGYTSGAREISQRINKGVADSNKWTGIENCSWLVKCQVTAEELESLVKEIKGSSSQYERNYIARTMLALDTHIDWTELIFDFKRGYADEKRKTVKGLYDNSKRTITVGGSSGMNTVAHEMGHALDYKWQRDLFGEGRDMQPLSENSYIVDLIQDEEARQFYKNFRIFIDSLTDVNVNYSAYTMEAKETFARFVARFVEWVETTAGGRNFSEGDYYGDKFTGSQYIEFVKLLQEKAMLDAKRMASESAKEIIKPSESNSGTVLHNDRDFSYNELVAKPDLQGTIISKSQQVKLLADGSIDVKWVVNEVKKKCSQLQTKSPEPTYYVDVPDIGENVDITYKGIQHGFIKNSNKGNKTVSNRALINARVSLELPQILNKSIEVNRSARTGNIDNPYSHILIGTVGLEDANGHIEYYAVRSVVEERVNLNSILVESEVLGRLKGINAKKVGTPRIQVTANNGVALPHSVAYSYKIADLLNDVKGVFDDTFSEDVYNHFGVKRKTNDFSKNLLFQDRVSIDMSPRGILAGALESSIDAKTPSGQIQLKKLREYKEHIEQLNELSKTLSEQRKEIHSILSVKGGRTAETQKRLVYLQGEVVKNNNRVNTLDKKLLNLEVTAPLKAVLETEKRKAAKRQKAKDNELMARVRERDSAKFDSEIKRQQEIRREQNETNKKPRGD